MEFKYLKYEVSDGILLLTMNQPEIMNAVNAATCAELTAAFDYADNDDRVRVIIVTGAGRAFSRAPIYPMTATGIHFTTGSRERRTQPHAGTTGALSACAFMI
jgi:1,4-dihydroxy-2-naphthoyl-CoA synthase